MKAGEHLHKATNCTKKTEKIEKLKQKNPPKVIQSAPQTSAKQHKGCFAFQRQMFRALLSSQVQVGRRAEFPATQQEVRPQMQTATKHTYFNLQPQKYRIVRTIRRS